MPTAYVNTKTETGVELTVSWAKVRDYQYYVAPQQDVDAPDHVTIEGISREQVGFLQEYLRDNGLQPEVEIDGD